MMQQKIITSLSERLKAPLPAWKAQKTMSPATSDRYMQHPDDAKQSAVMILISPNADNELQITYIKRTSLHPEDPHGGQISFPGGGKEEIDKDLQDTAVRECHEEIGVNPSDYKVLGALSPIYVYISNYYVQSYIGYASQPLSYTLQATEVDQVVDVPLSAMLHDDVIKYMDYKVRASTIKNMPYYDLQPHVLWGATAMITAELLHLIKEIK
jgi:8-oxo-dGTP pyrophosphatase MutT (NUDIX family)